MMTLSSSLLQAVEQGLSERIVHCTCIGSGRKNTIYAISTDLGRDFVVKQYGSWDESQQNRAGCEYQSLSALWSAGIRCIAKPQWHDATLRLGVYQYLKGEPLLVPTVTAQTVRQAADFIVSLQALRDQPAMQQLPDAADASFSFEGYLQHIEERYRRLFQVIHADHVYAPVEEFLTEDFLPAFATVCQYLSRSLLKVQWRQTLAKQCRILSPSDFGFHNMLQQSGGLLYFLDFEYFGWDDPAKLIADFFLQPDAPPPVSLRTVFFDELQPFLMRDPTVRQRVQIAYLFLSLKWCLIILNPFLRIRASQEKKSPSMSVWVQLEKARVYLQARKNEWDSRPFPLSDLDVSLRS